MPAYNEVSCLVEAYGEKTGNKEANSCYIHVWISRGHFICKYDCQKLYCVYGDIK